MKRTLVGLIVIALVLIGSMAGLTTLQAAPAWQTTQVAAADWGAGALVRVKASVPFVWVRATWSATGAIRATASSGDYLVVVAATPLWDGVQWWWNVRWGAVSGYVEQESMELVIQGATATVTPVAPPPTPTATLPPVVPPPSGQGPFKTGDLLRIRAGIPFVWLRVSPSSTAQPIDTVYYNGVLSVTPEPFRAWDGIQWWDRVSHVGVPSAGYAWVEENRVELVPAVPGPTQTPIVIGPTPTQVPTTVGGAAAAWTFGSLHSVRNGIPFAWIRTAPSSNAGTVLTLYPGWLVLIADGTPYWDGVQWWWKVLQPSRNIQGWIEQNSLF